MMDTNNKRLIDLTVEEVRMLFEEILYNLEIKGQQKPAVTSDLGGIEMAMAITGLKKATIYGLVSKSKVPCMKKSGRLFFSRKELEEWIRTGRRKMIT